MTVRRAGKLSYLLRDESGQTLVLAAVMFTALLGILSLVVGAGFAMAMQRELQASTDAAALAGAGALQIYKSSSTALSSVQSYSSKSGQLNASSELGTVSMMTGSPALKCLTTLQALGVPCVGAAPYNAVQVKQQALVSLPLGGFIGHPTFTLTASATAAVNGGAPTPYNIAVLIDTSLSMNRQDTDCGNTQMQCALIGLQNLLQNLNPCAQQLTVCTFTAGNSANSVNRVSLFTFPAVTTSTVSTDSNCTTTPSGGYNWDPTIGEYVMPPSNPYSGLSTATSYWFPSATTGSSSPGSAYAVQPQNAVVTSTYQVLGFMSDYKSSDTTRTLNTSSALVKASGAVPGCGGLAPSNYDGVYGTYYAGALYQAQAALVAAQNANPGSQNALIILSDGDSTAGTIAGVPGRTNGPYYVFYSNATSNGLYPSWVGQCGQAVTAAKAATAAGTRVYSVAYGSEPVGCLSDVGAGSYPNISPCNTMASMASAPQYFYSDYKQSGSASICTSSQPVTSLSGIFSAIAADLSTPRLIPDSVT
jgi:hypothetical protein